VDELVSLRIENQKLRDEVSQCHDSWNRHLNYQQAAVQAQAAGAPPATALACASANHDSAIERYEGLFEEPASHAPGRRVADIFGEERPAPPRRPQDHLDELVTLRLENERLKEHLRVARCFYAGVTAMRQPDFTASASPPLDATPRYPELPPAKPRLLGPKR